MKLSRLVIFVFVFFFYQSSFSGICINTSVNKELFGTDVGIETLTYGYKKAFRDNHFSNYRYFSANTNAELVTTVQHLATSTCPVVLGLMTSRECLILGPVLQKNQAIGFSPICGHDDVNKFYPYLYTATHPISRAAETVANYLTTIPNLKKIFVIYQPTNIYSVAEFSQFRARTHLSVIEVPVGLDNQFDLKKINYLKNEQVALVFFTYPLSSAQILLTLSKYRLISKNVTLVGASSWNDDISLLKPFTSILKQAKTVVAADIVDWREVKKSAFAKEFVERFNREPINIEVLNYDITRFVTQCYKKALVHKKYDRNKFQYCVTHTTYHGVSGTFSFKNHSSFADRPLYLTNILDRL